MTKDNICDSICFFFIHIYFTERTRNNNNNRKKNNENLTSICCICTEIRLCWLSYMMVIIEYIQYYNKWQCFRVWWRGLCVYVCMCVKLLRMNMHKQLNEEWSECECVCVCALCCLLYWKEQRQEKKPHIHTYGQMRRCTMKETYSND